MKKKEFITAVIPTYNEEKAIAGVIKDMSLVLTEIGSPYEIIVVDDGSTDGTADILKDIKGIRVIRHKANRGTGAARTTGIINARGDVIVMTDGDGTYPTNVIPAMLEYLPEYDMVIGARKTEAGTLRWLRTPTKWLIRKLASYIVSAEIPDLNSGLRIFKKEVVIKFLNILPATHSWVSTITLALLSNGYEVAYVPIDYYKRKGKSSFHPIKDTTNYLSLVIKTVMFFHPLRFFMPLSVFIFIGGMLRASYHKFAFNDVRETDIMIVITGVIIGTLGLLADLVVKAQRHQYLNLQRYIDTE